MDEIVRDRLNEQLLKLWAETRKTVIFVTHSIPEAVFLSTRIVVMSPRPGRIIDVIDCDLGDQRTLDIRETPEFLKIAHRVRGGCAPAIPMMTERVAAAPRRVSRSGEGAFVPVMTITALIVLIWYLACLPMNAVLPQLADVRGVGARYLVAWGLERPFCPRRIRSCSSSTIPPSARACSAAADGMVLNPRNLLFHAWVTLSATLMGFIIGALLGIGLAIAIVHSRVLQKSLMPWIIASQTVPILAIAPIIIVALGSVGLTV